MRRVTLALVAFVALVPAVASAQEGRAPGGSAPEDRPLEPSVTLPRVISPTEVPYPEGGEGDATVVLAIVIAEDGRVRSAEVERGAEPFASAARAATTGWRFEPARRDGVPIAAKILFEVSFTEAVEEVVEVEEIYEAPREAVVTPDAPAPKGPAVIDVFVEEKKPPPSVTSLRRAEVRQLPGAFGDPFRAIEIMPGVTPIVSGLPFFYVRGAPPGNVGYFLDGVRVPYLFHAAAGPSVVHPAIVDRVDLYAGGYPARFGRYAGAIVSAETTPPRPEWHGEGNVRLVDAGALVEGGFADGRGTALAAGRYSYTAGLFSLISPEITLDYRDYQARASYDITPRDRVSLFAFGSYDFLSQTQNDIETVIFGSEFYRVDGRYDVRFPGGGGMRAAVTWGFDQTRVADGRNTQDILVGSRVLLDKPLGDGLTLRGGFDVQHDLYSAEEQRFVDPDDPDTIRYNALFPPRTDAAAATFLDLSWSYEALEVTPGLRLDTFYSNGARAMSVDPRLSVVVKVTEEVRLLHALGMAHQPPSFVVPLPGLAVANLRGGLQRSVQASAGVEVDFSFATATLTVFDAVFLNMTDTLGVRASGDPTSQIPRSQGNAKGLEIYLRRSLTKRLGGFIAYTLSRSTRSIDNYTFPAAFDRTHVLHSAVGYDLGGGFQTGTRFSIYSGPPLLAPPPGTPFGFRPENPDRDPAFYRLDIRFEKRWRITETGWISLVIEMLNATLNTETINRNEIGPVTIPSIGVEGGF
jgi:TonB family protein